jgi:hypothetical protein
MDRLWVPEMTVLPDDEIALIKRVAAEAGLCLLQESEQRAIVEKIRELNHVRICAVAVVEALSRTDWSHMELVEALATAIDGKALQ